MPVTQLTISAAGSILQMESCNEVYKKEYPSFSLLSSTMIINKAGPFDFFFFLLSFHIPTYSHVVSQLAKELLRPTR